MRLGLFTTIAVALLLPLAASAQSLGGLGNTSSFTISISPQYPAAHSQVTLSFVSSTVDLTSATIKVSVDGKSVYQGSARPVAVAVGKAGVVTNVVVTVSSAGTNYTQRLSIQPQDVALVAEPISSSPPLYPGKSSVPLEGDVRLVAVANLLTASGKISNPSTYSYVWTVDDTQMLNSSGIGKNTIIVASPLQYRARAVSVSVQNADGSLVGGASLSLLPEEPTVRVYKNDPLLGILYDHALTDTYNISDTEATLYAAPFSLPTTGGAPRIQWFLNGDAAQTGASITLRPTGSGQGNASLSLTASAGQYTSAATSLSLTFGKKPGSNFFGL